MKIQLWSVGKVHDQSMKSAIDDFTRRIANYYPVEWKIIPVPRNATKLSEAELKAKEAELVLGMLRKDHLLVALDERGKQFNSQSLASFIQGKANDGVKNLVFLIGGAYGLSETILNKAPHTWSLSNLTFPHHLVRLILAEQIYRACTINRNEKYHHG